MSRPFFHRLLALCACVLLLGFQQESLRHGVRHLGERAAAHERALAVPAIACDECALLAGASAAVHNPPNAEAVTVDGTAPLGADATVPVAAPRHYSARAPPLRS
jgi:hypothetical protein